MQGLIERNRDKLAQCLLRVGRGKDFRCHFTGKLKIFITKTD